GARLVAFHEAFRSVFTEPLPLFADERTSLVLDAERFALEVKIEGRDLSVGGRLPKATATLPLEGGDPSCSCAKWSNRGECLHVGFATVVALDVLSLDSDFADDLDALLAGDPWARTLEALDDVFAEDDAEPLSERLAW